MTGIIGAVPEEAQVIKKEMINISEETIGGLTFFKGKFYDEDIVFVQSGVGKVNAAMTATILDRKVKVGDVVIGTEMIQHDADATEFGYEIGQIPQMDEWKFKSAPKLLEKSKNIKNDKFELFFGRILTGDQFISKKDEKKRLGEKFEALCVDMESAAVAQVCYRLNTDFLILRSISDSLTDESGMEYDVFVELAANNSKEILKEILK